MTSSPLPRYGKPHDSPETQTYMSNPFLTENFFDKA